MHRLSPKQTPLFAAKGGASKPYRSRAWCPGARSISTKQQPNRRLVRRSISTLPSIDSGWIGIRRCSMPMSDSLRGSSHVDSTTDLNDAHGEKRACETVDFTLSEIDAKNGDKNGSDNEFDIHRGNLKTRRSARNVSSLNLRTSSNDDGGCAHRRSIDMSASRRRRRRRKRRRRL